LKRKTSVHLLDVNVLLALTIRDHPRHGEAMHWFHLNRKQGFSTCAITQCGLVRLASNRGVYEVRFSHESALGALQSLTNLPEHTFWPSDFEYESAVNRFRSRITSYKQTTDAYLLGLAIHHGGVLATMDKGILELSRPDLLESVEFIG
jgi:toxin-antitoxin system PIN domain toxin